jgi:hypothetical protein
MEKLAPLLTTASVFVVTTVCLKKSQKKQHTAATEKREIEKHVPHKQQQVTGKMISYLSTEMMLQSLWRRGQQQRRDCYCSHGLLAAATIFCEHCVSDVRITARGIRESVRHPRRPFKWSPAGACQK